MTFWSYALRRDGYLILHFYNLANSECRVKVLNQLHNTNITASSYSAAMSERYRKNVPINQDWIVICNLDGGQPTGSLVALWHSRRAEIEQAMEDCGEDVVLQQNPKDEGVQRLLRGWLKKGTRGQSLKHSTAVSQTALTVDMTTVATSSAPPLASPTLSTPASVFPTSAVEAYPPTQYSGARKCRSDIPRAGGANTQHGTSWAVAQPVKPIMDSDEGFKSTSTSRCVATPSANRQTPSTHTMAFRHLGDARSPSTKSRSSSSLTTRLSRSAPSSLVPPGQPEWAYEQRGSHSHTRRSGTADELSSRTGSRRQSFDVAGSNVRPGAESTSRVDGTIDPSNIERHRDLDAFVHGGQQMRRYHDDVEEMVEIDVEYEGMGYEGVMTHKTSIPRRYLFEHTTDDESDDSATMIDDED